MLENKCEVLPPVNTEWRENGKAYSSTEWTVRYHTENPPDWGKVLGEILGPEKDKEGRKRK